MKVGGKLKLIQNDNFKIALEVTGCGGMEWPFYNSKIVECNNLELLHAILTCGMPNQFLSSWHHEKRTQEFISKISMFETNLTALDGYLVKSPETEYLDASEKSVNAYYLGLIFTKLFSMKEFDTDYFLHSSLFEQVYGADTISCNGRKKPSFIGYNKTNDEWSIWESMGKRDHAPKALDDAYNQVLAIRSVNEQAPKYAMACMTYFDTKHGELQGILRNAASGKKANIEFDKEQFLILYYRHICEIFDESLRRKPFDSVIDYIDGYLEIELELFGLNIDGDCKDDYLRKRRIKLGVPKEILGFFQYNKGLYNNSNTITSIVEALQVNTSFQDKDFFMGRDGIYFRIL
ncbi:MAG: hypothetical protein IJE23_07930 [Tyzzerella sp.]|nr:hypothetical protein [Tyzzerella sp.]